MLKSAVFRALFLASTFFSHLLLANLLEPAGLGLFSLMILNAALLSLITGLGVDAVVLNSLVQQKWSIGLGLSVQIATGMIQLALFAAIEIGTVLLFGHTLLAAAGVEMLLPELLFFTGLLLAEKTMVLYYSIDKALLYNVISLVVAGAFVLLLLVLWQSGKKGDTPDIMHLAAGYQLLQGCLLAAGLGFVKQQWQVQRVRLSTLLPMFRSSLVVVLTNVVQLLAYRIDYWLLRIFHSDVEVGIYAQSSKMSNLIWVLPNIMAMLLVPRFGQIAPAELRSVLRLAGLVNLGVAVAASCICWLLYQYWLIDAYNTGLQAFWLMLPGYLCWASVIYFGAFFSWRGRYSINLWLSGICLAIMLIADLALIPAFGINGAAIANSLAYCSVLGLVWYFFSKMEQTPVRELWRWRRHDFRIIKQLKW